MIAINNNDADGRNVSWLYDDVRVDSVEPDLIAALDAFVAAHPNEPRRVFCTYTAMMALRRTLAQRLGLPEFGEEVSA